MYRILFIIIITKQKADACEKQIRGCGEVAELNLPTALGAGVLRAVRRQRVAYVYHGKVWAHRSQFVVQVLSRWLLNKR